MVELIVVILGAFAQNIVMLSDVILSAFILNGIMLSFFMLSLALLCCIAAYSSAVCRYSGCQYH